MKILLTGKPGVGKSTLIQKIVKKLHSPLRGIIAKEIRNADGIREGFEAHNLNGSSILFAHIKNIQSTHVIGNKYHVDVEAINSFVVPEIAPATSEPPTIVIIDEIGRMQALSHLFLETTQQLLNSNTSFLGTIVLDPEPWSLPIKNHPDIILVEVTEKNRRKLAQSIIEIFSHLPAIDSLNTAQQHQVNMMLKSYFANRQYIQIGKLMRNALQYLTLKKTTPASSNADEKKYFVEGNTAKHVVTHIRNQGWICDCDLFTGKGDFVNKSGECSHIQSVLLFQLQ